MKVLSQNYESPFIFSKFYFVPGNGECPGICANMVLCVLPMNSKV